jgi:hypothetical protein
MTNSDVEIIAPTVIMTRRIARKLRSRYHAITISASASKARIGNASSILSMANSKSRGDGQFEQSIAIGFPLIMV